MACKWIEGFETHSSSDQLQRKYASSSGTFSFTSGRVFGTAATASTSPVFVTPSLGLENTWVLGFGVRVTNNSFSAGTPQGLYLEKGTEEQFHVEPFTTSSGFQLKLMRGATQVAISSLYPFNAWQYIELKVTARTGANGAYEMRVNGVIDVSGTGVNLANEGTDGADILALRFAVSAGSFHMDDMYLLDDTGSVNNDFLSPTIVEAVTMTGTGSSNDFANDSGGASSDNYMQVDDGNTPTDSGAGGTVSSDSNGDKDLYAGSDLTQITGNVHAVMIHAQAAMAAAGSRTAKFKYRDPDTTEADGDSFVVDATAFDEFSDVLDLNPASGLAWDVSDIDDGQYGIEVVS